MRRHFISYAGGNLYNKSSKRLKKEVKSLNIFDSVKIYRPKDLPSSIKNSFLYQTEERGNGYWIWKPYVILNELDKISYGDIIVYSDCGNKISSGSGWNEFWSILDCYDGIFQQYRDGEIYPWGDSSIKRWTKRSMIDFFSKSGETSWIDQPQFQSCFIMIKKNRETIQLIRSWFRVMWARPDLLIDTFGAEGLSQNSGFSEHRHDQAVLTGLLLTQNYAKVFHMPEIVEPSQKHVNSVVTAYRIRDKYRGSLIRNTKKVIKTIIGFNLLSSYWKIRYKSM